jgi:hypothetical protein
MTSSLALMVAYGYQMADEGDPLATLAVDAVGILSNSSFPGALAVNAIPARKLYFSPASHDLANRQCTVRYLPEWFPGAGFQTLARKCRELLAHVHSEPVDRIKKLIVNNYALPPRMIIVLTSV